MDGKIELTTDKLVGTIVDPDVVSGNIGVGLVRVVKDNYEDLRNKPEINGVELIGNKTSNEIGVLDINDQMTAQQVDDIWAEIFE